MRHLLAAYAMFMLIAAAIVALALYWIFLVDPEGPTSPTPGGFSREIWDG